MNSGSLFLILGIINEPVSSRQKLFETIGTLRDLNGEDRNGDPVLDSDEEHGAEDAEDFSDEDLDDEEDDEDGPGLAYLANSHILEDEDETEDYTGDGEEAEGGEAAPETR